MNIAFWSNVNGRGATSGNMLAIGTMASVMYSFRKLFLQYDCDSKPIEEIFEGKGRSNLIRDEVSYFKKEGIDELLNNAKLKELCEEEVYSQVKNVRNTSIYYLPSSKKIKYGIDDESIDYLSKKLPKVLENISDINFIDNQNGKKVLSRKIMEESDVIVVNICQGMQHIDSFLRTEFYRKKTVFLVGRYDRNSNEDIEMICNKYHIPKENIAVIPYNIHFHDAIAEGKVVDFISKSIYTKRNDVNFDFINHLYLATNMILEKAGVYEEKY